MEKAAKLELIAKAIRGLVKIQVYAENLKEWYTLDYYECGEFYSSAFSSWSIEYLLENEIREITKKAMLTEDECEFLKWFPQDYKLARNSNGVLWFLLPNNTAKIFDVGLYLLFEGITFEKDDGLTIGEMIALANNQRKANK